MWFALWIVRPELRRLGLSDREVLKFVVTMTLAGFFGAHVLYVLTLVGKVSAAELLFQTLRFYYGFVWYGGLAFSAFLSFLYARRRGIPFIVFSDALAPGAFMALAIGRVGCFLHGCCYGRPTDLPWGILPPFSEYGLSVRVHPSQLYELIWLVALFVAVRVLHRSPKLFTPFRGSVTAVTFVGSAVGRFLVEFTRGDTIRGIWFFGLTTSQYLSILLVFVAAFIWKRSRAASGASIATRS